MGDKTKAQRMASKKGMDELSIEVQLRRRHKQNYPTTILNLTKRIQAVNQTWNNIMWEIMNTPGLSINYCREPAGLQIAITYKQPAPAEPKPDVHPPDDVVELHTITVAELMTANTYVEVAIMDKINKSELIARIRKENE